VSRLILPVLLSTALLGCAHDNTDNRLDSDPALDPRELAAMLKIDCSQRREEVLAARDESQSDFDRTANYRLALKAFTAGAAKIEAAFAKEPDLLYLAESDALRLRLQRCQAQAQNITNELRKFELGVQFKPAPAEPETPSAKAAPAPLEPLSKKVTAAKKAKKKTAVAKRKKLAKPTAVLASN
jgi:hypothetical protein